MPFRVFDRDVFIYTGRPSDAALEGLGFRREIEDSQKERHTICRCQYVQKMR
jgi:hypothetical protein